MYTPAILRDAAAHTGAVEAVHTRSACMYDRQRSEPISPLLLTSRCRLTPKGRIHMDPARDQSPQPPERGMQLNQTGRFVIERCDGAHSVSDVARELALAWGVPETQATADVLTFLERLRRQGLVHADD